MVIANPMQNKTQRPTGIGQPVQAVAAVSQLACGMCVKQAVNQLLAWASGLAHVAPLLFQPPVWRAQQSLPLRGAGVGPAEAQSQKILDRLPSCPACRARGIRVESAKCAVRSCHPARQEHVQLKSLQMCVRRDERRWAEADRNPGEADLQAERQREVDGTTQSRVTCIELEGVDVLRREGQHS
ncbi:hypothetical protein [Salipiger marinus]|uniref:hypothetical protein n=1 Tax=Salipiger marinus TaxID=555512 RepID=UPI000B7E0F82|nr:hypothetical protein [Salipiger marinus]